MESPEAQALLLEQIRRIMDSINLDEPMTALNETSLLLKTLDEPYKKEHKIKKLEKKINNFLLNPNNHRLIRLNNTIKKEIETYIEYLDQDIGNDERLYYQNELEQDLMNTMEEIRKLLALIITTKLNDDITFN